MRRREGLWMVAAEDVEPPTGALGEDGRERKRQRAAHEVARVADTGANTRGTKRKGGADAGGAGGADGADGDAAGGDEG